MTQPVSAVALAAVLLLTACGDSPRATLDTRQWVDRPLVEESLGVDVLGGGAFASGESVHTFDLADGATLAVAAHYTDRELVSEVAGTVIDEFDVDCVSVAIYVTSFHRPGDAEALGHRIRERMQAQRPNCPRP